MENFNFWMEADVDLVKSGDSAPRRIIRGYASTPSEDRQGESMVQKGLDITNFVNHGWLNYDHDNSIILGYPTENTKVDDKGLWVEGELLPGVPMADNLWELAVAIKKSNAPRRLGFSIEGKVMERDGNRITKAKIYNCALTPNPVNTDATWEAVVKSFRPENDITKGLEAGYATTPDTQQGGGALRKESLASSLKNIAGSIDDRGAWEECKQNLANGGDVSKAEMAVYLQLSKGLSRAQADDVLKQYDTGGK